MRKRTYKDSFFGMPLVDVVTGALGVFIILTFVLIPAFVENPKLIALIEDIKKELNIKDNDKLVEELKKQKNMAKMGFIMNSKKVLFVVDLSGSMKEKHYSYNGQDVPRILTLIGGLKTLLATMDGTYQADIVVFNSNEIKPLWGELKNVKEGNNFEDIYKFVEKMPLRGDTPTYETLKFVLKNEKYNSVGSIILMTDGIPTDEKPEKIIEDITKLNKAFKEDERKKIITMGIGNTFYNNENNEALKFMEELAKQNDGFFVGM